MMKTLNYALRTILLITAIISTATTALAYDFMVNGIYYNFNGDDATVTYMYRESYYSSGYSGYHYYNDNIGYVTIPETVTYNGKTYTVTAIGDYAFCHYNSEGISGISIPNSVTSIGMYAFQDCDKISEIMIPETITSIGNGAFYDCDFITNITVPHLVTSIKPYTFYRCDHLNSVIIGESVTDIGDYAFEGSPLRYITCLPETPPTVPHTASLNYCNSILYTPLASVDAYRTTFVWNYFTDIRGFGENYFSIPDETTFHGDTIVIPVSMENVDEITAFQTDIYLPDGFELIKDGDDYMVELTERKGRDHIIMMNDMPDGALRILSYSPTLKTFSGNEGELFYLTVKVPDNADGKYRIELNNTIVTTIDEEEVHALNASCDINVNNLIMGDVDGSGEISVADVVQTARYILNHNPQPFIFDAADINGDGKISITDVVKIAHMVLDADYVEPTQQIRSHSATNDRIGGEIDGNTVGITLDNSQEFTAFQFDVTLPEGIIASDFALTERASDLSLNVKNRGNGKIRVMAYALDLTSIKGSEGNLLTFNVAGNTEIEVDAISLVTPEGQSVHPAAFTIAANNTTSVNEYTEAKAVDHVDYYNLAGQRIGHPEDGMTIVVTTYTDGSRTTSKVLK